MKFISLWACLCMTLLLGACSALNPDKVDYKSASKAPAKPLDVPPDLTKLSRDPRYNASGGVVTASGFQTAQTTSPAGAPTAPLSAGDVRIERAGTQRWLVVDRPADKLWEPVKDFWQENGFLLALDQSELGIMETDWAENRAKIPQGFLRNALGKLLDTLYSTGERDKFRTRLERTSNGGTEIYISHRGLVEVYTSDVKDRTVWQPRPTDPELETEFLRRLMVKLGVSQEQSRALTATAPAKQAAQLTTIAGLPVVRVEDGYDRAWRRVGLTLDRTGFTVEDRDRGQGIYFVRYVAPVTDKTEPGFFSRLFGAKTQDNSPQKYRIRVSARDNAALVSVLNVDGNPETSENAERILKVIAEDLQ